MNETALSAKIEAFLHTREQEIIERVATLTAIPSVSGAPEPGRPYGPDCAAALDAALAIGGRLGFTAENHQYYYGSLRWGEGHEEIGLFTHLDVVPAGNNWSYPPFECTRQGAYLIGRGVKDDKGPLVMIMYAMACIKELGIPLKHSLHLIMGCEEEQSMSDMEYYLEHTEKLPVFSLIADGEFPVSYGEKGILTADVVSPALNGNIAAAEGGSVSNVVADQASLLLKDVTYEQAAAYLAGSDFFIQTEGEHVRITARGKSSHAAAPEGSVNAVYLLCRELAQAPFMTPEDARTLSGIASFLNDYYGESLGIAMQDEYSGKLTHIAGILSMQKNGALKVNFNIRYPISAQEEDIIRRLSDKVAGAGFTLKKTALNPPGFFDPLQPVVRILTDIYNKISGDTGVPYVEPAATYARKIPNSVCFGPHFPQRRLPFADGRGGEHMPDECISIPDMLTAIKIYVFAILAIDDLYE
ncbi:MAG TPA: Sapep family Mn(2+)-dependent dipeptidase [Syntrophomonas sp.]|nr:Sapep family Mn(2+)-dependent dipeptidase [Syntrophomonas sp.]